MHQKCISSKKCNKKVTWTLGSHILVNIHSKSKNRTETNQNRWAKQTSHTSVAENGEKPQNCKMSEQLLKGIRSLREGLT